MLKVFRNALVINDKSPLFGVVCLLYTIVMLVSGLWPFNFHPPNEVEWLKKENGIGFYGRGMASGPEPLLTRKHEPEGSLTVELLLRPQKEYRNAVPSILTLYGADPSARFTFCQWKKEFMIRIPEKPGSKKRYREIAVSNALLPGSPRLITVVSTGERTAIYLDGKLGKSSSRYPLIPIGRDFSGYLVLGNAPEGDHPWNGAVLGLAVYDFALTSKEALDHYHEWKKDRRALGRAGRTPIVLYPFDERGGRQIRNVAGPGNHIVMPESFEPLQRVFLHMPERDYLFSRSNLADITINIAGFAPFGFFLSAWLRGARTLSPMRASGVAILSGFCLSLVIELVQACLPARDSSSLDLLSNTFGAVVGVLVLNYTFPRLRKAPG